MFKSIFAYCQYLLPQHLLSTLIGKLADCKTPSIKNTIINQFIKIYKIDMREAAIEDPAAYPTFNAFFTRALKPGLRVITKDPTAIACPVDGTIAQIGNIEKNRLLQVKGQYFTLETLLGGQSDLANLFMDGAFTTLYLAPNNYHRVHMPLSGHLEKQLHVPGDLFSVNRMTSELIPNLYARNERVITLFQTDIGPMAVILVGAMIVGSIEIVETATLSKGDELGRFKLGSTVILLFAKNKITWDSSLKSTTPIQLGQSLGNIL